MSDYNKEYVYNAVGDEGGTFYNTDTYFTLINLKDILIHDDNLSDYFSTYLLEENQLETHDTILSNLKHGYNSGYVYNADYSDGGLFYNLGNYIILINLKDTLNVSTDISKLIAKYVLQDNTTNAYDTLFQTAIYKESDRISFNDYANVFPVFNITDKFGITEEISALLVLATLYDSQNIIDEVKQLNHILSDEKFKFDEPTSLKIFLESLDSFGLKDLKAAIEYILYLYDRTGMTDSTPRSAVSDFFIGSTDDLETTYDWLIPFNLKIDWNSTSIQVMPEASNTIIEMPGVDGSIIEDTVYKDRLFQIVAFSEDGLTGAEKESLKSKITEILDSTKHTTKKLTVEASENSFDVKYDGQAVIAEGPSYIKATIPFRASAYGYKTFEGELRGSGLVYNNGDTPIGPKHIIYGGEINPSFVLGEITYNWLGEVPFNSTLVIDHQMMTCYLQDEFGVKTNAMAKLTGEFQKIPSHSSVALTYSGLQDRIYTTWRDRVLW